MIATDEKLKTVKFSSRIHTLIIPLNVYYLASQLSQSKLQPLLLMNNTEIPFITSDNPVINLCADYTSNLEPKKMALYSSFSPSVSLVCASNETQFDTYRIDDSCLVRELNQNLILTCDSPIYSNDKTYLEEQIVALNGK